MDKDQTDNHLRYMAMRHTDQHNHHTAHIPGKGWLCQQCDDDFATWILDGFGREDIHHYSPDSGTFTTCKHYPAGIMDSEPCPYCNDFSDQGDSMKEDMGTLGEDENANDVRHHRPKVGEATRTENGVIIPSYVRLSEHPKADGSCTTGPLIDKPCGWYVEYRFAGGSQQYRGFFLFSEVKGTA